MSTSPEKNLLFVVGMHRSGTSALCAALRSCGATFGSSLLDPMSGVNDEGFWEDVDLVRINDQILDLLGVNWYTVHSNLAPVAELSGNRWLELKEEASALLKRGFGDGQLAAVKDPRLCITLPFWLTLCDALEIQARVCITGRAPLDVARSLLKRDGFPLGFGLRLYATYRKMIAANTPADATFVGYNDLLENPVAMMSTLAQEIPLTLDNNELGMAVRSELRHQSGGDSGSVLDAADSVDLDLQALDAEIAKCYPRDELPGQLAESLVHRGQKLTAKGLEFEESLEKISAQHIVALSTLDERDAQIAVQSDRLETAGIHLSDALAVIPERDSQIEELNQRLEKIGAEHSYALEVINERDQQIRLLDETRQKMFDLPVVGRIFRKLWSREEG